ncbi:hypothetical protein BDV23DRAFT_189091 [Aspergillus alliaceus]|uniref:Zn(2)-C6 fungal-type domain-containing protein n=1 Tax=Petromyces alliaceus TaxID=209559 RepID=A0A5N7BRX1_PETAA|nr:hypothetical protein BDV23DRAFT_189091 [Aspergillus alliaceus]
MSAKSSPATAAYSRSMTRPPRVLACMLCQQRKVRCDREFPCANCIRADVQCVPCTGPRQRRRRFPERELLERLRRYESLLRENNIKFEPLHASAAEKTHQSEDGEVSTTIKDTHPARSAAPVRQQPTEKAAARVETSHEAKDFWHLANQMSVGPEDSGDNDQRDIDSNDSSPPQDDVPETIVKKAWDQVYQTNDLNLLFASCKADVDLSSLHPEQVQIFKLWQVYLDNVNPLLKITHTPTLQPRIIDAAGNVATIRPTLEALMFSIYCVSILSLSEDECRAKLRAPREDLLKSYQFRCQQALLKCGVLRSGSRECLTALYLYLISVRPYTDPRSVSSILGLAIRIAQRMGIDKEATYSGCPALEGEMRRRLWWSLIIFDNRICEMVDYKNTMLTPIWDCRVPLNVNDFDIQPEMKVLPMSHDRPTEAMFAVVRSEIGEFIRHSPFHLDFANPSLKTIAKDIPHSPITDCDRLKSFENVIEGKYLRYCNPENPLHFMTIWMARGQLAKNRLLDHYSKCSSLQQTDAQRDTAISYALTILECDTKLMTSPLTKRYLWLTQNHFPFPAYIHILKDLKNRPIVECVDRIWATMSDNYVTRCKDVQKTGPLFDFFSMLVLQAWKAREAVLEQSHKPLQLPLIVSNIKQKMDQMIVNAEGSDAKQPKYAFNMDIDTLTTTMSMGLGSYGLLYGMEAPGFPSPGLIDYSDMTGQGIINGEGDQPDWATTDWYPMHDQNW